MKEARGDMFSQLALDPECVVFVTTNSTVRRDGELVMGRGAAKSAKQIAPELARMWGKAVEVLGDRYGLIYPAVVGLDTLEARRRRDLQSRQLPGERIGAFQVKQLFHERAELSLITGSTALLREFATWHAKRSIHLNFPGIGNGRLRERKVRPVIETLPDNVTIWKEAS